MGAKRTRRGDRTTVEMTRELLRSIVDFPMCAPESPIILTRLSDDDADSTRIVRNARCMLDAMSEGPQKLTEKMHWLNRKFVRAMFEQFELDEDFAAIRSGWGVLDEDQVWPLSALRDVMQIAGLVRVLHGKLLITKRGQQLREPGRGGELHHLLFTTYFLRYNIAATDRFAEDPEMQNHFAFSLFRFGTLLRKPLPVADFAERLPHDDDLWMKYTSPSDFAIDPDWELHGAMTRRILEPLVDFGLLISAAGAPVKDKLTALLRGDADRRWSITPLFDRFVSLRLEDRVVGLGDVSVPAPAGAQRMTPVDKRMSVRESVEVFSREVSGGDRAIEQMLAMRLMMLELVVAAPFMRSSSGSKAPIERAIAEIPRLMKMAEGVDAQKSGIAETAVIAAVFASYVDWCMDVGQARHEVGARAMVALKRWLPDEIVAASHNSLN